MSKTKRQEALEVTIDNELVGLFGTISKVLLWMFVKLFRLVKYYKQEDGIKKFWYALVAIILAVPGFLLDVLVNEAVGRMKFREQYEFGTLSNTIQRVINAGPMAENYDFAKQIAVVLNDNDEGHIKL